MVPHVAQNCKGKNSAIDGRTTRHPGYVISQRRRKRVDEIFGNFRKTPQRGEERVGWMFTFMAAAFNMVRIGILTSAVTL